MPQDQSPEELSRRKQLSREQDALALASGEKTREQLRQENSLIRVAYDDLVIVFPGSVSSTNRS